MSVLHIDLTDVVRIHAALKKLSRDGKLPSMRDVAAAFADPPPGDAGNFVGFSNPPPPLRGNIPADIATKFKSLRDQLYAELAAEHGQAYADDLAQRLRK